jgi:hypothetical protein
LIKVDRVSRSTSINVLDLLYVFIEKLVNKLLGRNDIEDALKRLETLTMEEARMAIAETLNVTHRVDDKVTVLIDGEQTSNSPVIRASLKMEITICKRKPH